MNVRQKGFTLIEIAIVLLIVAILLGYTVALFPIQQELKQYKQADTEMNEIIDALIGFAQVNGRLPCPAIPNSLGAEDIETVVPAECNNYGGFVPVATLGIEGRLNGDSLLMDPWGNPYRYYVSNSDVGGEAGSDFIVAGDMRTVGLVDEFDVSISAPGHDSYIDLDGQFIICDAAGTSNDDLCAGANLVFGDDSQGTGGPYAGAPFVLVSHGKDWSQLAETGDQLENLGSSGTTSDLGMAAGPSGFNYTIKNVAGRETTFVKRLTGFADDFDDIVKWASPNLLFSKMIEADQLP